MEVAYDVVGVMVHDIETSIGEYQTSKATKSETYKEAHDDHYLDSNDVSSKQR